MSIRNPVKLDPACQSAVAALEDDPFYRTICVADKGYGVSYRATLAQYFAYSIQEGRAIGRSIHPPDNPASGVAVWLLPQGPEIKERAMHNKQAFLKATLTTEGCANYYRILEFMGAKAKTLVDEGAWYLSIIAVDPAAQGRGLGGKLLEPTIAETDHASATSYVETFNPRNISFYQRLGFTIKGRFTEPTSGAEYTVMVRCPMTKAERQTVRRKS